MGTGDSTALFVPNWLGDCVMTLPAVALYLNRQRGTPLTIVVKEPLRAFWDLCVPGLPSIGLQPGLSGMFNVARQLRGIGVSRAVLFPRSHRAALIALAAGIPERRGFKRSGRDFLLTDAVESVSGHQSEAYAALLLGNQVSEVLPPPNVPVPEGALPEALRFETDESAAGRLIGFLPGAQRGPSKRWPPEHYTALGRALIRESNSRILLFGTKDEATLCAGIAAGIGPRAVNLAGCLPFRGWLQGLSLCRAVVCNDSGGMHVAAALNVPTVAIFGITDPGVTGPRGAAVRILQKSAVRTRSVPRDSTEACEALRRITPEDVLREVQDILR